MPFGSQLAKQFMHKSRSIANKLVEDGIAADGAAVEEVLKNGFYHLYGPDSVILKEKFV